MHLVKQNMPFQGNTKETGNFNQLLKLCNKIAPVNHTLPTEYASHQTQNELTQLCADKIHLNNVRKLQENKWFGIMADEATDCSNKTVLTLLHRSCDVNLEVHEIFMGLHVIKNTKAETIVNKILVSM